ncbi:MAG: hypothetical protein GXO34_07975 [Deltaproteobacteria bacterium]|nr:hypothetical protein [Deltaproteobacteria bacterium]
MLLITAAVIEELRPLLEDSLFIPLADDIFRHASKPVLAAAAGIGLVDFTAGLEELFSRFRISRALLTGTCGVYPAAGDRFPLKSLVSPLRITLGDASEIAGSGYFPGPMACRCELDEASVAGLLPGTEPGGHCLTLASITSDDAAARRAGEFYRVDFEQMEAFSFARVCQRREIPAALLLAVANLVGSRGHRQWRENAGACAEVCARALKTRLDLP